MKEKKKGLSLKLMLILFAMIPLVFTAVVLMILTTVSAENSLEDEVEKALKVASYDLREYYQYDIQNNSDLENGWVEY